MRKKHKGRAIIEKRREMGGERSMCVGVGGCAREKQREGTHVDVDGSSLNVHKPNVWQLLQALLHGDDGRYNQRSLGAGGEG